MKQYIDRAAIVAEIEKLRDNCLFDICACNLCGDILSFLDTLEVKEVDLDKDIRTYLTNRFNIYEDGVLQSKKSGLPLSAYDIIKVAEHFFELGLKTQKGE